MQKWIQQIEQCITWDQIPFGLLFFSISFEITFDAQMYNWQDVGFIFFLTGSGKWFRFQPHLHHNKPVMGTMFDQ